MFCVQRQTKNYQLSSHLSDRSEKLSLVSFVFSSSTIWNNIIFSDRILQKWNHFITEENVTWNWLFCLRYTKLYTQTIERWLNRDNTHLKCTFSGERNRSIKRKEDPDEWRNTLQWFWWDCKPTLRKLTRFFDWDD